MTDKFKSDQVGLSTPPVNAAEITPSDTVDLQTASRCLIVATTGTVRVTTVNGDTVTLFVAAGITFPVRVSRIWSTGTTATGIVAMS